MAIGAYNRSYGFFNGTIDEAAIYDRALSPSEIQASFNEKTGGFYIIPNRKGKHAAIFLNQGRIADAREGNDDGGVCEVPAGLNTSKSQKDSPLSDSAFPLPW